MYFTINTLIGITYSIESIIMKYSGLQVYNWSYSNGYVLVR